MISNSCSDSPAVSDDGRLVHDDDARVHRQRLGDLDHLHLARGQRGDRRRRRNFQSDAIEQGGGSGIHPAAMEHAHEATRALVPEKDVGGDVEVGRQHQLLVDERDAQPLGLADIGNGDRVSVDGDLSLVGRVGAAQDLHQRALAGAVFAHQRQHLARLKVKRNALQRDDARKALRDRAHREQTGGEAAATVMGREMPKRRVDREIWVFFSSRRAAA